MKTLAEAPSLTTFFFTPTLNYAASELLAKRMTRSQSLEGLRRTHDLLTSMPEWNASAMESPLRTLVEELGLKPIQLFTAIRIAVTGRTVSPPLFETMEVLGRSITLVRLEKAIALLSAWPEEEPTS
jgi:glutamyl-tRNA synthetase